MGVEAAAQQEGLEALELCAQRLAVRARDLLERLEGAVHALGEVTGAMASPGSADGQRALHLVLELAYVAGPGM